MTGGGFYGHRRGAIGKIGKDLRAESGRDEKVTGILGADKSGCG